MRTEKLLKNRTYRSFAKTNALLERAEKVIPLGSQTFSKSHLNFVRGAYPLFLERGKGARVWDVDGNEYIDFLLGLMPVVLGYGDEDVNQAIIEQMHKGISFSFSTAIESDLAEMLIDLIPSAEMVRFGKNGSDATAGAVRVARAYTAREKVAVCGYHSWHDWYIASTPFNLGIPEADKERISKFNYNDLDSLETLLKKEPDAYAAVMLEPANAVDPAPGFLEGVRDLAHKYGALLVFDEIVSGWRTDLGGAQAYYKVTPDLSCFGKAMGNGMPIAALVGKREYMQTVEKVFLSSTFGGETLSIAASIATINKMKRTNAVLLMHKTAGILQDGINKLIAENNLTDHLNIGGVTWWPRIQFCNCPSEKTMLATSLLRQELAEAGIIHGAGISMCLSHCLGDEPQEILRRWALALPAYGEAITSQAPQDFLRGDIMKPPYQVR